MMVRSFDGGILIANRGEIALRVMRTARRLGYRTVAVYSDADRDAPHVTAADAAVYIGPAEAAASYLDADAILDAAKRSGAQAIHPGYGFLAERADFAARCEAEGIVFIGPSAETMRVLGDKAEAKRLAERCGVPVVPGYHDADQRDDAFVAAAERIGFPVMVKAAAGGGGRGMRHVAAPDGLVAALASARAEALAAFGDGTLLLERALVAPYHIEIQIAADVSGHTVHLFERDCSLQRRYQKLVEESPVRCISNTLLVRLAHAAVAIAREAGYIGVGTIEFLVDRDAARNDADDAFYFIEANTRLQVEHTVTEAVIGVDLVEWQIVIARGEVLPLWRNEIRLTGHAIEVRLCAEDPAQDFLPQTGVLLRWEPPQGVRVEHALAAGMMITPWYDSMIAKLIAYEVTREEARRTLIRALETTIVLGVMTNASYLLECLRDPAFVAEDVTTAFVAEHAARMRAGGGSPSAPAPSPADVAIAAVLRYEACARRSGFGAWTGWSASARPPGIVTFASERDGAVHRARITSIGPSRFCVDLGDALHVVTLPDGVASAGHVHVEVDGRARSVAYADDGDRVFVGERGVVIAFRDLGTAPAAARAHANGDGTLRAPTSGRVLAVRVAAGERVAGGTVAVVLEAMKMEHDIVLPRTGIIGNVAIGTGDHVALGDVLVAYRAHS